MTPGAAAVDPSRVTPGVLGFLVVLALGIATWLLLRSMSRRIRGIQFPEPPAEPDPGVGEQPSAGGPPTDDTPTDGAPGGRPAGGPTALP